MDKWESMVQLVSDGYFPTLQLRLIRGRLLTAPEVDDGRRVVVVNQTLVNAIRVDPMIALRCE